MNIEDIDDDTDLLSAEWDEHYNQVAFSTFAPTDQLDKESETHEEEGEEKSEESDFGEDQEDSNFNVEEMDADWIQDRTIKQVISVQENLFVATESNQIIHFDSEEEQYREFVIDAKSGEKIHRVFVDPTGFHVIISMTNGDNYYFNTASNRNPKKIRQMKNIIIESVGWDKQNENADITGVILIGTQDSCIFEARFDCNSKEPCKGFRKLFDFRDRLDVLFSVGPITGLEVEIFPKLQAKTYLVIATTELRLFQFIGGPNFVELFEEYTLEKLLVYKELPSKRSDIANSCLRLYRKSPESAPESFAWLNSAGIYHGTLTWTRTRPGDSAILESEIIEYDAKAPGIKSITITEFHTYIVLPDKLQILLQPPGLCTSPGKEEFAQVPIGNVKVVFTELYPQGELRGITRDEKSGTVYIWTDSAIYTINVEDPEKDVWKLFLEKALDPSTSKIEHFDTALRLCRNDAKQQDLVLIAKADHFFNNGKYDEAADIYAKTTKSFEQIAIAFYNKNQRDALRKYLLNKLAIIIKNKKNENQDATQLSCLCTWLVEIFLDKINELKEKGPEHAKETQNMIDSFREFLTKNKQYLNEETTFQLISSHGQMSEVLFYAMLIEDYERVISHHITNGEYEKALEILSNNCKTKQYADHFYKFAPVLMQHLPKQMVATLVRKRFLEPGKLIPALMRYVVTTNLSDEKENQVIKYLEWCVNQQQNEDPAIHNLLLSLYAKEANPAKLLAFLNVDGETNHYDPKYALRVCSENQQWEACIRLYSSMGLYEDAVELALNQKNIELAKECADRPEEVEYKKRLWLRIAKHVIENDPREGSKKAIKLLSATNVIKLEDILPYFQDFVLIDNFKEEICKSLEEYKAEIRELKQSMNDATQNATLIRDDIKDLRHRYAYIASNQKCDSAECFDNILSREFYVFPCGHMLHTNCLVSEMKKHISAARQKQIDEAMHKREELMKNMDDLETNREKMEQLKELDALIGGECPYCGSVMIQSVDSNFVDPNEDEIDTWAITRTYEDDIE